MQSRARAQSHPVLMLPMDEVVVVDPLSVDADGQVTLDDAALVLSAVGTQDPSKEQTGDCWIWVDDVAAVLELVEQ
jgi:hypothetical protein